MTMAGPYGGVGGYASTYGDAAGFPALGFDPAPGAVSAVDRLASWLRGLAERVAQAEHTLTELAQPGSAWRGQAAQAFSGTVSELPGLLRAAQQSLGEAGRALEGWSVELPRMQDQARTYERQAQAAKERLQAAQSDPALQLSGVGAMFSGEPLTPQEKQAKQQAEQQLQAARDEYQRILASAKELEGLHQQTAQQVERSVRTAMELAPTQSVLEKIGGAVGRVTDPISDGLQATWDWVQRNAEEIAWVGDVLGTVSGALGIAAIVLAATGVGLPLAAVLAGAAAAAGVGALVTHGVAKAAGAKVGWTTIALDSAGVALGGTARVAARGVKAMQAARNAYKTKRQWGAAREVLHGPMRRARAVRDYSGLGSDAVGLGGTAYSGVDDQYREVWDSDQWMGGKYKSAEQSSRPPRREVSDTFCKAAQTGATP